jgi:hypothetical protein
MRDPHPEFLDCNLSFRPGGGHHGMEKTIAVSGNPYPNQFLVLADKWFGERDYLTFIRVEDPHRSFI